MSGLDTLIARSMNSTIRENLGQSTLEKVEQRLFEKHGIGITQAIEEFHKIDSVLREFFGDGAEGLEKQFLQKVITLQEINAQKWVIVQDPVLAKSILEAFGDEDKKEILNSVLDESKTISEILEITMIPQTSGYRKVNYLIDNGLLIPHGSITTQDGKSVTKYRSIFENININIEKNKVIVEVQTIKESLENSSVIKVCCKTD